MKRFALSGLLGIAGSLSAMTWPTPHPSPAQGHSIERFIQPTVSGETSSGLFGCVRNNGTRFHEGIDIAPFCARDRRGEATDRVVAAFDGRVAYINKVAGDSSYGRYIVLEHPQFSPAVYTLYGHLASVDPALRAGRSVTEGDGLGVMGRSAGGYVIPKSRAHLHFEIGVRLTNRFQDWYDRQKFGSKNEHRAFNGMNLLGLDALDAYRWLRARPASSIDDYYRALDPGLIVEVVTKRIPDFVRRYPALMSGGHVPSRVEGWRITFSGWGLPLKFEPLAKVPAASIEGQATVVAVDPEEVNRFGCRHMIAVRDGRSNLGKGGQQLLELLFDFY